MTILKALVMMVLFVGAPPTFAKTPPLKTIEDRWELLLKAYVKPSGGVDYIELNKNAYQELEMLVVDMGQADFKSMDDKARLAAYINLYNAGMMFNVLRYAKEQKIDVAGAEFPKLLINKIKVEGGNIWNGSYKFKLGNSQQVTLDDVEHGLIRGEAKGDLAALKVSKLDPRIHAAVNCAAYSCPRVREKAYRAANLEAMLTENMHEYLNTEAQFQKLSDSKLKANQIVLWYYKDFDQYGKANGSKGAGDYLAVFVKPETKDAAWKQQHLRAHFNDRSTVALRLSSAFEFHYDWRVNDQRNK